MSIRLVVLGKKFIILGNTNRKIAIFVCHGFATIIHNIIKIIVIHLIIVSFLFSFFDIESFLFSGCLSTAYFIINNVTNIHNTFIQYIRKDIGSTLYFHNRLAEKGKIDKNVKKTIFIIAISWSILLANNDSM